jgi:pre-rRNA-processing protein TSR3
VFPHRVLRHKKENLKKCSLSGLEERKDFKFYRYPRDEFIDLSNYFVLSLGAPLLTREDSSKGLMLVDGTWRYAEKMLKFLKQGQSLAERSLPAGFVTAYPRKQDDCPDPSAGLASIEAFYVAFKILGYDTEGLLKHYYFADEFLKRNQKAFETYL